MGATSADQFVAGRNAGAPRPLRPASANASARAVVYVAGEVLHPGVYALAPAGRDADAVHAAGGPTHEADLVAVNLAAPLEDGSEIIVPAKDSAAAQDAAAAATALDPPSRKRRRHRIHRRKHRSYDATLKTTAAETDAAPVPLNAADAARLETLPGIGPALAARIVAFRDLNGPFASIDELLDVSGMTQSKLDALSPSLSLR
jgi:competence protein ComEA